MPDIISRIPKLQEGVKCINGRINMDVIKDGKIGLTVSAEGRWIVEQIDGNRTTSEIVNAMSLEYDAGRDILEKDVTEFLIKLETGGILYFL